MGIVTLAKESPLNIVYNLAFMIMAGAKFWLKLEFPNSPRNNCISTCITCLGFARNLYEPVCMSKRNLEYNNKVGTVNCEANISS